MPGLEYWARHLRGTFVPQIEAFADSLTRRVLPGFDTVNEEARRIETEAYDEISRALAAYDEEPDLADAAEQAHDYAIDYSVMMAGIVQGILNLFGAGLWHLFEQQLATFARRGLPYDFSPPNPDLKDVKGALLEMGIDIAGLASFERIDELRLLANCAKHGDGTGCAQLRARRPDLFIPGSYPTDITSPSALPVIAPFGGDDLYITVESFKQYADAVVAFWEEFATKLEE